MRKPVFVLDINFLGKWYWCEIEGYEKVVRRQSGAMIFLEREIMGWNVDTLGDIWEKQREVNFSPRWRFRESENENDAPTAEERAAGSWDNWCRIWLPDFHDMRNPDRAEEFLRTGRTVWEEKE